MHRLNMCEELGRGWDRIVISCELQQLSAPHIQIYQEFTKVSLFSHLDFTNIPMEDKIWATYLHACIKYIEGGALTNSSLRERFGVTESSSGSISRLIKEVLNSKLIKPVDPNTAPRYMKYIPIWGNLTCWQFAGEKLKNKSLKRIETKQTENIFIFTTFVIS